MTVLFRIKKDRFFFIGLFFIPLVKALWSWRHAALPQKTERLPRKFGFADKKKRSKKGAAKMLAGDYCIVSLFSVSFCGLS